MKAADKSFFFLATPSYYDIPFFQRAYVWEEENWSELFNNLTSRNQNHFLGSIILKNELSNAGSVARYSVIDGQQRLTTLSILLRACYDHIVKHAEQYGYDEDVIRTCKVKMEGLLFVSEGGIKQTLHVKINHSHLDKSAFESVINGELDKDDRWEKYVDLSDDDATSSIIKAYSYFRSELQDVDQDTIDYLWELLTVDKIKFIVNINLDVNDNEQAIFDTVNSAGVRLSSADTIKNLVFQRYVELLRNSDCGEIDEAAVKEYEDTWVDAFLADEETNTYWETQRQYGRMRRSNLETFLHAFAVVEGFFNPAESTMSELPQEYRKKIFQMKIEELDIFLNELHDYANVYRDYFSDGDESLKYDDYIGRVFNICNVLEVSTFYPYLLKELYAWKKGELSEEALIAKFYDIERYVIINAICKGSTKNYNNECKQLIDKKRTPQELFDNCMYITEGNFANGLRRMTTNKLPTLLLFWVELYLRKTQPGDIDNLQYSFTLEHIMPQKWAKNWSNVAAYDMDREIVEDADEIERIRNHAIYEIGNMTLLNSKLNSSISNGAFLDKINGKNGRKGIRDLADLRLTKDVINNNTEWNELKIYDRTEVIESLIREIWNGKELPTESKVKSSSSNTNNKQIRLQFWEKALPIIRKMNDYESFGNVNPTTSNFVSGSFGIGSFSIICNANTDKARVDMFLCKKDKEKNKEAYDILYNHKAEIETALGINLHWDRADELKASWVSYSLEAVSITNEDDWDRMIAFLGEWSTKLRRVMVPYLVDIFPQDKSGKSPEEVEKLLKIANILKSWTIDSPDIIEYPEKCNRTYTRFMTKTMSALLPDLKNARSDWNTENHYFYEIVNRSTTDVRIQLSFNSKNIDDSQRAVLDKINTIVTMKQAKEDWFWWIAFKTDNIDIPEDFDKDTIYERLDAAFEKIREFEDMIVKNI